MFRICRQPLDTALYSGVRAYLYSYSLGGINSRQLLALCEVRMYTVYMCTIQLYMYNMHIGVHYKCIQVYFECIHVYACVCT